MKHSIKTALQWARETLSKVSDDAASDAEYLMAAVCRSGRAFLYTHPEYPLEEEQWRTFQQRVQRRVQGEPIAYLLGEKTFWTLSLLVGPGVLIPRPETELLVEEVLHQLPEQQACRILDIGTGSGAIALALAHSRPAWSVTGVDISETALVIARQNQTRHALDNVRLFQSDLFGRIPSEARFDAIVSNPPYIETQNPCLQQGDLRFEPRDALASGEDGLFTLRQLICQSPHYLAQNGLLLLEHGYQQGSAVRAFLKKHGFQHIQTRCDLQGHERVSFGVLAS